MTTLLRQLTARPLESPCDEAWESMHGDDRVRRCDRCDRDVFHVSAMSPLEAELRLLNAGDGTPCIRYLRTADGGVAHAELDPIMLPPRPARSLVAATALGVTLSVGAPAFAGEPTQPAADPADAPTECVAYAAAFAEAPPAAKPAPAKAAAEPTAPPQEPPRPVHLAGKPMMPREKPIVGTLTLKSKTPREVTIVGITLKAPLSSYLLSPGAFAMDVLDPRTKKTKKVRFTISKDKTTVVDLDKR